MQTFLPYPSFEESVRVLDYRRLGKQRVEAYQLLLALEDDWAVNDRDNSSRKGWINHPCTRMWRGYEDALGRYMNTCIEEWMARGYNNTMHSRPEAANCEMPWWLGDDMFHRAHQSNLLRKDPEYYGQYFQNVPDNLEYIWPQRDK